MGSLSKPFLVTPVYDFSAAWTGTRSRLTCDEFLIKFLKALEKGTLFVQRSLRAEGSGTMGSISVKYTSGFTYSRVVAANDVLNDPSVYILRTDNTTITVVQTNTTLKDMVIDYDALNLLKNASASGVANAANAVDEDASTMSDSWSTSSSNYATIATFDIRSVVSFRGIFSKHRVATNQANGVFNLRLQYSMDGVDYVTVDEWAETTPVAFTEYIRARATRLGSAVSARYVRIQGNVSVGTGDIELYEILALT